MNALAEIINGTNLRREHDSVIGQNQLAAALQNKDMPAARSAYAAVNPTEVYEQASDPEQMMQLSQRLLRAVESAPPEQRAAVYAEVRDYADDFGMPMDNIPEEYPGDEWLGTMSRFVQADGPTRSQWEAQLQVLNDPNSPEEAKQAARIALKLSPSADAQFRRRAGGSGGGGGGGGGGGRTGGGKRPVDAYWMDILLDEKSTEQQKQIARVQLGLEPKAGTAGRKTVVEVKRDLLVESGTPVATANRIVAGQLKVSRDPVTGEGIVLDLGGNPTGETIPSDVAEEAGLFDNNLYGRADDATGVVSGAQELATDTLGQIPIVKDWFDFGDTVETRQTFQLAVNDLVRALSLNPRFPVGEIERIRKEINISPSVFTSPDGLRARMRAIDKYLRGRLTKEQALASNKGLGAEQRRAAAATANAIGNFLDSLSVPQNAAGDRIDTMIKALNDFTKKNPNEYAEGDQLEDEEGTWYILQDGVWRPRD